MPFKSQKQRAMFWKAEHDPKFRKKMGLTEEQVDKMTEHDKGGKLPERAEKDDKKGKKRRRKMPHSAQAMEEMMS